ncbi:hypothetical protein CASFOL_010465 [Castilleja foliolosa]|uniref:Uncharacterized protein n=1 Tax=Castilleja foliolosa TaxID=1961234 RepID=A0ABD3DSM8_9LAMI
MLIPPPTAVNHCAGDPSPEPAAIQSLAAVNHQLTVSVIDRSREPPCSRTFKTLSVSPPPLTTTICYHSACLAPIDSYLHTVRSRYPFASFFIVLQKPFKSQLLFTSIKSMGGEEESNRGYSGCSQRDGRRDFGGLIEDLEKIELTRTELS